MEVKKQHSVKLEPPAQIEGGCEDDVPKCPPLVSIVMPVYNGSAMLGLTLQALARQTIRASHIELVIVDDGSSDDSVEVVASVPLPFRWRLIQQSNAGLAVARNKGIAEASGKIILFLDQDMIADAELIAAHIHCHSQDGPALVAGRRVPWPQARTSPVTQVLDLESTGAIPAATLAEHPYQIAIGANLSIPRSSITAIGGFDEDFPAGGGFEDVEMAYRAYRAGLKVIYCKAAVGSHNHPKTLEQVCGYAKRYSHSLQILFTKHPELRGAFPYAIDKEPISWTKDSPRLIVRKSVRSMFALPPVLGATIRLVRVLERLCPAAELLRFLYRIILGTYQLLGMREGAADLVAKRNSMVIDHCPDLNAFAAAEEAEREWKAMERRENVVR